jgi:hypothetical protein
MAATLAATNPGPTSPAVVIPFLAMVVIVGIVLLYLRYRK